MAIADDREHQLRCMRPGCGNPLTTDQAYFCSQDCLDLFEPDDLDTLDLQQREAHDADEAVRVARMDRLREENPERYLVTLEWQSDAVDDPQGLAAAQPGT